MLFRSEMKTIPRFTAVGENALKKTNTTLPLLEELIILYSTNGPPTQHLRALFLRRKQQLALTLQSRISGNSNTTLVLAQQFLHLIIHPVTYTEYASNYFSPPRITAKKAAEGFNASIVLLHATIY